MSNLTVSTAVDNFMGAATQAAMQTAIGGREILTANRTYYVRTDGNDSNTGLVDSSGGAFLTIQKGLDVAATLDGGGLYSATVKTAAGTWTVGTTLDFKPAVGMPEIILEGDTTTPANVILEGTTRLIQAFKRGSGQKFRIQGVTLRASSGDITAVYCDDSRLLIDRCAFGSVGTNGYHMIAISEAVISIDGNYTISGGAFSHFRVQAGARIDANIAGSKTVTVSGSPAFNRFCWALAGGYYSGDQVTYSGSATGTRHVSEQNSIIFTNGLGTNLFPGNSNGTTATGGIFIA
jgi:hypothetical protein